MPTKGGKEVFLRAKQAILKELHDEYGVPKIAASSLEPSHRGKIGQGRFAEVFVVPIALEDVQYMSSSADVRQNFKRDLGVDVVAVKILKEDRIDQLLVSFQPPRAVKSKKKSREQEEKEKIFELNAQRSVDKILQYYKRESVIWQKCSGNQQLARENNFVELFGLMDSYQDSHMPVFISRYVAEGSVRSFIMKSSNPSLSDRERLLITSDIAKALNFLHSLGMVHRDVKGRNILIEHVGERFVGLLGDFGSSKIFEDEDFLRGMSSTMNEDRWAPPEYLLDSQAQHAETGAGDIWALGCTLLEILQEQDPWQPLKPERYKSMLCEFKCPIKGEEQQSTPRMAFRHVEDSFYGFMEMCWQKKEGRISAQDAHLQLLALANECS